MEARHLKSCLPTAFPDVRESKRGTTDSACERQGAVCAGIPGCSIYCKPDARRRCNSHRFARTPLLELLKSCAFYMLEPARTSGLMAALMMKMTTCVASPDMCINQNRSSEFHECAVIQQVCSVSLWVSAAYCLCRATIQAYFPGCSLIAQMWKSSSLQVCNQCCTVSNYSNGPSQAISDCTITNIT